MPKMKTNKAAVKRVRVTASGKFKKSRPCAGHLKSVKSPARLRGLRRRTLVPKVFEKHVRKMLALA